MTEKVRDIEWREFDDAVMDPDAERPVVVEFRADWCEVCDELDSTVERLADDFDESIDVVAVDLEREDRLANEHDIYETPTLIGVFRGNYLRRLDGPRRAREVEELFDYLTSLPRAA